MLLGENTAVPAQYAPEILDPIPRQLGRAELGLAVDSLPFSGEDVWHGWELSWLDSGGVPQVGIMRLSVPCTSPMLVESKSLKLYLNSLNQMRCSSVQSLQQTLVADISAVAGAAVGVEVLDMDAPALAVGTIPGSCIDQAVVESIPSKPAAELLMATPSQGEQQLHSHLLRSLCPVTAQPDWATLVVKVEGVALNESALLGYLLGFRQHQEFHEQCVERIFCDLQRNCQPEHLTVQALYTRRGGLDINPFRSSSEEVAPRLRSLRQ